MRLVINRMILSALFLLFMPFAAFGQSQSEKAAQIKFDRISCDMGAFTYKGKSRSTDFTVTNTGDAPLVIIRTEASCNCISVKFPKKPIMPGENAVLTVTYNPKNQVGHFDNSITVYSNTPERTAVIFIEGDVTRK